MNKLSAEFEAGVPLSPSEYEGLLEVEAANAQMVGYRECGVIGTPSTNGHEPAGRLDFAERVTSQFIKRPGSEELTKRPHRHTASQETILDGRKAARSCSDYLPAWRLRMPSIDGFEDGYEEDIVTAEAPKADPRNSWSEGSAISFAEAVTVKVSKNRWEDPDKSLEMLELTGVLEQVVKPLDVHGAINGVEIVYASQLDPRSYIARLFT